MKISTDCIPCFVKQAVDAAKRFGVSPEDTELAVRKTLRHIDSLDWTEPPPLTGRTIQNFVKEILGCHDPYAAEKKSQSRAALTLLPLIENQVYSAEDPFAEAVRFSIAGNAIDLGALTTVSSDVIESFERARRQELPVAQIEMLKEDVAAAKSVLFLTDNCGEVIFDRPLMNLIGASRLIIGMRGRPTINDCTVDDARMCGFPPDFRIISNGSDIPGTWIPECSAEFVHAFMTADVVIAKGQGNYETLNMENRSIYFLLLVKCPVIAQDTGCVPGTYFIKKRVAGI